jgi:hypothetical protein
LSVLTNLSIQIKHTGYFAALFVQRNFWSLNNEERKFLCGAMDRIMEKIMICLFQITKEHHSLNNIRVNESRWMKWEDHTARVAQMHSVKKTLFFPSEVKKERKDS